MLHQWFDESALASRGAIATNTAGWGYEGLKNNEARLRQYYQEKVFRVDGRHVLALLLRNLPYLGKDVTVNTYSVLDFGWQYANRFELSHPVNQGRINPSGWFYAATLPEIYILDDSQFDVSAAMEQWKDLSPIKVVHHPYNTLSMGGLLRQWPVPPKDGYVVISIHLAKLSLQYQMWKQSHEEQDVTVFLAQYPLINALQSHLDVAIANRFKALWFKAPVSPLVRLCPMALPDYTNAIDRGLTTLVDRIRQRAMTYGEVLEVVPLPFSGNWKNAISLPDRLSVFQIKWSYAAAKLPTLVFLLSMKKDQDHAINSGRMGQLRQEIRAAYNEKAYHRCFQPAQWGLMKELETLVGYDNTTQRRP